MIKLIRKYGFALIQIVFWIYSWYGLQHNLLSHSSEKNISIISLNTSIVIFCQIIMVYSILGIAMKKYYYQERYWLFIFISIIIVILGSLLELILSENLVRWFLKSNYKLNYKMVFLGNFLDSLILSLVFVLVYLAKYYFIKDRKNRILENERLKDELLFLKAQLNPHFLFNALNNIHVLMTEDIKKAESTLLEFSDLLRYQIYELSSNQTNLNNELEFINNYIRLEKLRFENDTQISFVYPHGINNVFIPPFLLMPFIENAFKHISHLKEKPNFINIDITHSTGMLTFIVENTIDEQINKSFKKGIGIENVKRRLDLLFPKRHLLKIKKGNGLFRIELLLSLKN